VRTFNSRAPSITGVFGWDGGWNHNYNWIMEDSPTSNTQNFQPVKYTVDFPDGRVETFRAVTWDTVYRVRPGADTPAQSTSAGVRERFLQLNLNNMYAYLILPDGGAIEFKAQQYYDSAYGRYWYKYHVTGIYDPYGLKTTIDSEVVNQVRRITRVTEPAGRYLQFSYGTTRRISWVTEYINGVAKRSVQYNYNVSAWLTSVVYYGNSNWTASYQYCAANLPGDLPVLLWTCDDPMYPGPMHKIAYTYQTGTNSDGSPPVYGQISSENYFDGTNIGTAVSTLTVGAPSNHNIRTETRGDTRTRTFNYSTDGYLQNCTDFMNQPASQGYDDKKYINYVVDRNNHRTDYTSDPLTGNVTQIQFPLTPGDTPGQGNTRPTVNYTYTNNYYLHTVQDEGTHITTIYRDGNNRVSQITYADGGYETFPSYNSFGQVLTHQMTTGGTETFTYNWPGSLRDTYRNPDNPNGNASASYQYDNRGRVSDVTDALNHTTSFAYNDRGQLSQTTLPPDPFDNNNRHTITNYYNPDGTVFARQNELYQTTSYTYDDYRRVKSVTTPVRGFGDNGTYTSSFFYDANGTGDDYRYTDSSVTYVVLPSGKKTKTVYDDNRRKSSVTVGYGTTDAATTSYGYDNVGNLTSVTNPLGHWIVTNYDERNRPSSINDSNRVTAFTYDTFGRKRSITRPNGQVVTYEVYDEMNRLKQQRVSQTPGPDAVTKYTYYAPGEGPVGLLHTMQDPRLVQTNSGEVYIYEYDTMGRKTRLWYPLDSSNARRSEQWSYDTAGRLQSFMNRDGWIQSLSYDALNRITGFTWNDGGLTPSVSFGYDAASRLTSINNANANISRVYYNDNLLRSETEQIAGASGSKHSLTPITPTGTGRARYTRTITCSITRTLGATSSRA
jgi:YD repeat-containing protein